MAKTPRANGRENTGRKPNARSLANLRKGGGRPPGSPNKVTRDVRAFCQGLIEDPAYQKNLRKRWNAGTLPPQLESMIWHYTYGKPKETHELTTGAGPLLFQVVTHVPQPGDE